MRVVQHASGDAAQATSACANGAINTCDANNLSAARALARALSRWWLPTLAAITLAGSWIYVGYAFSKFTFALYLNSSGLLAMYFAHKRLCTWEEEAARLNQDRLAQTIAQAKNLPSNHPPLPAGFKAPKGWKPGDGCPAMLPDSWFSKPIRRDVPTSR